jgi:UDP-3-O-[3-hydroxymyristoyl] glucosamine N-acyltransferase LpxD
MKLQEIISAVNPEKTIYSSGENVEVKEPVQFSQDNARSDVIFWCNDSLIPKINELTAGTLICSNTALQAGINKKINYLVVSKPRLAFLKVLELFAKAHEVEKAISSTAVVHSSVRLGKDVYIGEHVVIEKNCTIGLRVKIGHNTTLLAGTQIGDDVIIGCNNTIGGIGFGYEKDADGNYTVMPHLGNVIIHDKVEIGNNTCIDRAVIGSTIIGENVKIDNLVHIAHGVVIGKNSLIIANAMIGGSTVIGENCWVAPSASVINKGQIADGATVGMGAVVTKPVEKGAIVAGNPARTTESLKKINDFLRKQTEVKHDG